MRILRFILEQSLGDEIVFVTDPPLTDEVMRTYNERRGNKPDVSFTTRNGHLIVRREQYESWAQTMNPGEAAEIIAREITRDETMIADRRAAEERQREAKIQGIERFFGVRRITEGDLRNVETITQ